MHLLTNYQVILKCRYHIYLFTSWSPNWNLFRTHNSIRSCYAYNIKQWLHLWLLFLISFFQLSGRDRTFQDHNSLLITMEREQTKSSYRRTCNCVIYIPDSRSVRSDCILISFHSSVTLIGSWCQRGVLAYAHLGIQNNFYKIEMSMYCALLSCWHYHF